MCVRTRHGLTYLKMSLDVRAADAPPGRGDFWILKIAYAPSDKNLSKNGSAHRQARLLRKREGSLPAGGHAGAPALETTALRELPVGCRIDRHGIIDRSFWLHP